MCICLLVSSTQVERITQLAHQASKKTNRMKPSSSGTKTVASSGGSTSVISTEDTAIDDVVVDDNYVFRGFLAWCLWGWIPIQTGAKIKSSLFTDGKANALYGRKTMLRQALKSAKHAHAAKMPVVPAAKKTLTITIPDTKHKEQTAHRESTSMLKWALELFKTDLAEKELQKRSYL
jgi:hypothetical protein